MNAIEILKGTIVLEVKKSKKSSSLKFTFKKNKCSLEDTFMYCFENLNLHTQEKRNLTFEHRQMIRQYQDLDLQEVQKYSNQLVNSINNNSNNNETIYINASEVGSFICLAAIYSGKIKPEINIHFNLTSAPLKLFPTKLIAKKVNLNNINIHFDLDATTWLSNLATLTYNPKLNHITFDYEEELRKIG